MDNELRVSIGQRVRNQRLLLELSQDAFSEKIEISPQFLSDVERGKKAISAETLFKICKEYSISPEYILFGIERETVVSSPISEYLEILSGTAFITVAESVLKSYCKVIRLAKDEALAEHERENEDG